MPYANDIAGIYKIVDAVNGRAYVGQSGNVRKRIAEHFRLLRANNHPNPKLQNAFNKHGESNFRPSLEVMCEDIDDLDTLENAFISGDAIFPEPVYFNIADFAKHPMRGRKHTTVSREKISASKRKNMGYVKAPEYKKALSAAQIKRNLKRPGFLEKIKYIVSNPDLSYAERARRVGSDTSTVRKLFLRYEAIKDQLLEESN